MKRNIIILVIILLIVAVCIIEELVLANINRDLKNYTQLLSSSITENTNDLSTLDVEERYNDLKDFWKDSKRKLCYLTNYEKIRIMDESIVKLGASLENNDESLTIENLAIIEAFSEFTYYFMGFNINNLF